MPLKLRPLSNRIVVRPDKPEEMSKGGIFIPESAKYIPQMGTVEAIGPGRIPEVPVFKPTGGDNPWHRQPMAVKEGDRIFFSKNAGSFIQINERDNFIVLRESEVLALVIEDDDATASSDD